MSDTTTKATTTKELSPNDLNRVEDAMAILRNVLNVPQEVLTAIIASGVSNTGQSFPVKRFDELVEHLKTL
jgi:hypothetical protein